jgi:hypothetical protein
LNLFLANFSQFSKKKVQKVIDRPKSGSKLLFLPIPDKFYPFSKSQHLGTPSIFFGNEFFSDTF